MKNRQLNPDKIVVIFSGGLDSTTLLYKMLDERKEVWPLTFDYGQKHAKEIDRAESILINLDLQDIWLQADVDPSLMEGSSQTDASIPVPEGHYAEESMKITVVPNRNMVMIASAVAYAISIGAGTVAYGAHAGDHTIYPDCRKEFVRHMQATIFLGNDPAPTLIAPFIDMTKAEIVAEGARLEIPFDATWSCYKGGTRHCGKCGTCVERREAFQIAGVVDPTLYE